MNKNNLTVADFFCGAGGFSEGFRQNGFDIVYALDNWKPSIETHKLNHPNCINDCRNILEIETPEDIDKIVPDTDIIIGSPPCVAFSGSNKAGKADKSLGVKLIERFLRIVAWKKSKGKLKYWILENVPNSKKYVKDKYSWKELGLPGNGKDLIIKERNVFDASLYGSAQVRKRFFCGDYVIPEKMNDKNLITIKDVMNSLGNPLEKPKQEIVQDPIHKFSISVNKLTDHFYDSRIEEFEWKKAKRLKIDHGFMGKMSFPEDLNRPSRTVMATMSASTRESMIFEAIKNNKHIGYRLPTIREVATFMGFPINYQFFGSNETTKYKQVGNAVCVPMISALAKAIRKKENLGSINYIKLPDIEPPTNLNGKERVIKIPRPRREDAKFSQHIPHLKLRGFRVDLTNRFSNFSKQNYKWNCILHYGSGKGARLIQVPQDVIISHLSKREDFKKFKEDVKKQFEKLKLSHNQLQKNYIINDSSSNLSPENILKEIRNLIDKNYPEDKFLKENIEIREIKNKIKKDIMPIRIASGVFACNYFINNLS